MSHNTKSTANPRILIPLAEGCEEIEAVTMVNVLRRASLQVTTVSLGERSLVGSRNIGLNADANIDTIDPNDFQMIALPGGATGPINLIKHAKIRALLGTYNKEKKWIAAICAAPAIVLQPLGILDQRRATCYPALKADLKYYEDSPVVIDGHVITGQGPACSIKFSLALVNLLAGESVARKVADDMLYFKAV